MTFSDRLGAQASGQEGVLLPADRPSDSREVAALSAAGSATDNEFADDFAQLAQLGDEVEQGLNSLADALKGMRDKLAQRVAKANAEAEQAKADQAAAEEETKAAQAEAEKAAAERDDAEREAQAQADQPAPSQESEPAAAT